MDAINAIIMRRQSTHKLSLSKQQWRPWQSASKLQGCLANKQDKSIVRALWVSRWYSSHKDNYCCKGINHHNGCGMDVNSNVLPISAGATGRTLDKMMATIIIVSMANTNNKNNKRKHHKKITAAMTRAPHVTHAMIAGQAVNWVAWQSQWHRLQWGKN